MIWRSSIIRPKAINPADMMIPLLEEGEGEGEGLEFTKGLTLGLFYTTTYVLVCVYLF